jgi:hypothetical protein
METANVCTTMLADEIALSIETEAGGQFECECSLVYPSVVPAAAAASLLLAGVVVLALLRRTR